MHMTNVDRVRLSKHLNKKVYFNDIIKIGFNGQYKWNYLNLFIKYFRV